MTTERLIARAAALGIAAFCTLSILAGLDGLAAGHYASAATSQTAAVKATAPRT